MIKTTLRITDSRYLLAGTLTAVVSLAIGLPCASLGDDQESQGGTTAKVAVQEGDTYRPTDLEVCLADDFEKEYPAPHHFDMTRWSLWKPDVRTQNGYCLLSSPAPGKLNFSGFGTRNLGFNPGLAGTNGVEIDLVGYDSQGDDPEEVKDPDEMRLVMAWGLTLGNWHGMMGEQPDKQKDRGVQLHLDLILPNGLYVYLVRGIVPEDLEKYPLDGYTPGGPRGFTATEKRAVHEEAVDKGEIFVSAPCLCLATRVYRSEQDIAEFLGRSRRWGLYLADDANTVYWTLDGKVMDRADISGYFSSSPESVREGAHLTISALMTESCTVDDLAIYASPSEKTP